MAQILNFPMFPKGKESVLDNVIKNHIKTNHPEFSNGPTFIPTSGEESHWAYPADHPMVEFLDDLGVIDTSAIFLEINKALEKKLADKFDSLKGKE